MDGIRIHEVSLLYCVLRTLHNPAPPNKKNVTSIGNVAMLKLVAVTNVMDVSTEQNGAPDLATRRFFKIDSFVYNVW